MFFDSLIRRKQSILAPNAPNFESLPTPKQIYSPTFETRKQFNLQKNDHKIILARSKSERELNPNYFHGHLKHPILNKDKMHHQIVQNQQYRGTDFPSQQRQQGWEKQKLIAHEYSKKNIEILKSRQKYADFNEYDFKTNPKTLVNQKYVDQRQVNGSKGVDISSPLSQLKQNGTNSKKYDRSGGSNQINLKNFDRNFMSSFNADSNRDQHMDNETTKLIDLQYENSLRATVKTLQKQILTISQQRDRDKNKLLEYSLNMDKLKTENDILKKSSSKSKQNLENRYWQKGQVQELKKIIRQQIQGKQSLLKEKQSALAELNEALNSHEVEKILWEREKKMLQVKLENLSNDKKQRVKQNLLLVENVNGVCEKNRVLRENNERLENQLIEKQNEINWMSSKVNQLKQALEFIKRHGNSRIVKLEQEFLLVENKRKESTQNEIKSLQIQIKDRDDKLKLLGQQIKAQRELSKELKLKIQDLNSYKKQIQKKNEALSNQLGKKDDQIRNLRTVSEANMSEKLKIIETIEKNLSECSLEKQRLTKEMQRLQQQKISREDELSRLKQQISKLLADEKQMSLKLKECETKGKQKAREDAAEKENMRKRIINLQSQNQSVALQLQRTRKYNSSLSEQKGSQQSQMLKLKLDVERMEKQRQELVKKMEHQETLIKEKTLQHQLSVSQLNGIKKQLLLVRQQCKNYSRQNQASQILLQQKDKQIKKDSQELENLYSKITQQSAELQQIKQELKLKNNQQAGKTTFTQLQMRLCSVLGIYLTSSVDKMISPIEDLMKSKRHFESSCKFLEQIGRLLDIKEGEYSELLGEIRQLKNGYNGVVQRSRGLQQQLSGYKQENSCLIERIEWVGCMGKRYEGLVDEYNEVMIKLRLRLMNEKYNSSGLKKY